MSVYISEWHHSRQASPACIPVYHTEGIVYQIYGYIIIFKCNRQLNIFACAISPYPVSAWISPFWIHELDTLTMKMYFSNRSRWTGSAVTAARLNHQLITRRRAIWTLNVAILLSPGHERQPGATLLHDSCQMTLIFLKRPGRKMSQVWFHQIMLMTQTVVRLAWSLRGVPTYLVCLRSNSSLKTSSPLPVWVTRIQWYIHELLRRCAGVVVMVVEEETKYNTVYIQKLENICFAADL